MATAMMSRTPTAQDFRRPRGGSVLIPMTTLICAVTTLRIAVAALILTVAARAALDPEVVRLTPPCHAALMVDCRPWWICKFRCVQPVALGMPEFMGARCVLLRARLKAPIGHPGFFPTKQCFVDLNSRCFNDY